MDSLRVAPPRGPPPGARGAAGDLSVDICFSGSAYS